MNDNVRVKKTVRRALVNRGIILPFISLQCLVITDEVTLQAINLVVL